MTVVDPHVPVAQLVIDDPARARVLERLGIDYCCGGDRPLEEAAERAGVPLATVLDSLADAGEGDAHDAVLAALREATLTEIVDHLEATHHAYLWAELPRLDELSDKVLAAHGERHPELARLRTTFEALRDDLVPHLRKEELILFPLCRELDAAEGPTAFHCGTVANPIRVMRAEHDRAGELLGVLRHLTDGYRPPEDACPTWRALLAGLAELEADTHRHVHLENNVLFPAAEAREAALASAGDLR